MKVSRKNNWYRFVCALLGGSFGRLLNVRIDNAAIRGLEGPFIAISNHPCFLDWGFAALALKEHDVAFIVNRLYFRGFLGFLLKKVGAVPRSLMTNDMASVRQMLRLAREGVSMCMFPDPSISLTGDTEGVTSPGTYKFLKRLGMTVIGLRHEGSFHSKTPWGKGFRRGRVDTRAFVLFTPEELKTLPETEGEARLKELVEGRVLEPRARGVAYKSRRRAENLEKLFFLCPHCGAHSSLASKGDRVFCQSCGRGAVLNEYYELVWDGGEGPESLSAWYELQRQASLELLEARDGVLEDRVIFHRFTDETGFRVAGEGLLRLDGEGLRYAGDDGTEYFYPIDRIQPLFQKLTAGRVYLFEGTECHEFEFPGRAYPVNVWRHAAEHFRQKAAATSE